MHDSLQPAIEAWVRLSGVTQDAAIFCAAVLVYLLAALWAGLVVRQRAAVTLAAVARIVALAVVAYLASKVLAGVISDPRPYIVAHTRPLIAVGHDNGFPSDHTLLAATLTVSLWWISRRALPLFAVGTLLVALGRLGIGAHHTLDVAGSMAIALLAALVVGVVPVPPRWTRPVMPLVAAAMSALRRPVVARGPRR